MKFLTEGQPTAPSYFAHDVQQNLVREEHVHVHADNQLLVVNNVCEGWLPTLIYKYM